MLLALALAKTSIDGAQLALIAGLIVAVIATVMAAMERAFVMALLCASVALLELYLLLA